MGPTTLAGLIVLASLSGPAHAPKMSLDPSLQRAAVTCFGKGEQISGMNKICYYDCLGSAAAITISATSLCPLTIQQ